VKGKVMYMRLLRKPISYGLLLCIFLLGIPWVLSGCSNSVSHHDAEFAKQSTEKIAKQSDLALKGTLIIDCAGRKVEIPANPARIAALDSFAGEALVMIGAGDKMVAAPNGVKIDRLLEQIYPGLANVGVPMSNATINAESLMELKPALIILKDAMYTNEGECNKIEKLGIPYLVVGYKNMEDQIYAIKMIGDAVGGRAKEKAYAINDYYRDTIKMAQNISKNIPEDKRYRVYHSINEIVRTDGLDTLGYDWVSCVGAVNVSAQGNLNFVENDYFASMEQIFVWDPDIVICNEASTVSYLLEDPKWAGLRAVYQHHVYNIPVGATRWGQRGSLETFFAILWLGTTIYPEYYQGIDLKKEVCSFYKDYLGIELDDATYQLILKGDGIRGKSLNAGK